MRRRLLAFFGLLALGSAIALPVHAQANGPFAPLPGDMSPSAISAEPNLHFTLVPGPKGNILIAWGSLGQGDAVRMASAMSAARPLAEIQFNSPGGSLAEGLAIGRSIRKAALATRVTTGSMCMSACNFAFMGGVVRVVENGGRFGVHMFRDNSARLLVRDIREPPRSVEEWNDRFPNRPLRNHVVEDQISRLNAGLPPGTSNDEAPPSRTPYVADPLAKENKPRPSTPAIRQAPQPTNSPSGGGMTVADFFRHPDVQESMVDARVRDIQQDAAQVAAEIAWFLVEMRLSLSFLTRFADVPSATIRVLTPQELRELSVVN